MIATIINLCVGFNGAYQLPINVDKGLDLLDKPCFMNWRNDKELYRYSGYTPLSWKGKNIDRDKFTLLYNEPEDSEFSNVTYQQAITDTKTYTNFACCNNNLNDKGFAWLTGYVTHGGKLPDTWSIHIYHISIEGWESIYERWLDWYKLYGGGRPVIISETSLMYAPIDTQKQLIDRLKGLKDVKAVYWFSADTEPGLHWNSELTTEGKLNKLGMYLLYGDEPTSLNGDVIEPLEYLTYLPIERKE